MNNRNYFYLWSIMTAICLLGLTGCEEEKETLPTPEVALQLISAQDNGFEMNVITENAEKAAYVYLEDGETEPTAAEVLSEGNPITVNDDKTPVKIQVTDLEADTDYVVYAAAQAGEAPVYSNVARLAVKTSSIAVPTLTAKASIIKENQFDVIYTAKNADTFYSICLRAGDKAPAAEEIVSKGMKKAIADEPVKVVYDQLEKCTDYKVYALAANSGKGIFGEIVTVEASTDGNLNMVTDYSAGKTSISYSIDVAEGVTYRHTYIEGWYYDYMIELSKETEGDEFDQNVVIWNLLADFGHDGSGFQEVTWNAGEENPARHDVVRLVGGKKYYILASLYDPEEVNWMGTAEAVEVTMKPAGESQSTVNPVVEKIEPKYLQLRLEPSEGVSFFFYDLYKKDTYDTSLAQNGQEWMENYVFEYGYTAANMYTDSWHLDSGQSYMLAIFGVDIAGDVFFLSRQYDMPEEKEEIIVKMEAYERPDEGCFSYETIQIDVNANTVKTIDAEDVVELFMPTATLNATLDMLGMNMESLRQHPENVVSLGAQPLTEAEAAALQNDKHFTSLHRDLEQDTEYTYLILIRSGKKYILGEARARTDTHVDTGDAEPEYMEFVGEWTVKGKTTEDYSSQMTFDLRIEPAIVNRSFKVYGWGNAAETDEIPFTARYDSESKKLFIDGHQDLGTITLDGSEYRLMFCGMILQYGETAPVDFAGVIYEGKCNGTHMSLFPGFVDYFEVTSMGYFAEKDGNYFSLPGNEYHMISFSVDKK